MLRRLRLAMLLAAVPLPAAAQYFDMGVAFAPPPLPVYVQPPIPGPDYLWTPGYWAWDGFVGDYYWVPGTWVLAPRAGLLWTPPWWGWSDGAFLFHAGYWAPHVGFYGGVSYGFGYPGSGFFGALWQGNHLSYNSVVTNVANVHVTNIYRQTVVRTTVTNISYNGGPGGVRAQPTAIERAQAMREPRLAATANQQRNVMAAQADRRLFAAANAGRPPVAASPHPAQFAAPGVVAARGARADGNASFAPEPPRSAPGQAGRGLVRTGAPRVVGAPVPGLSDYAPPPGTEARHRAADDPYDHRRSVPPDRNGALPPERPTADYADQERRSPSELPRSIDDAYAATAPRSQPRGEHGWSRPDLPIERAFGSDHRGNRPSAPPDRPPPPRPAPPRAAPRPAATPPHRPPPREEHRR